jgi:hypothetical protein
MTITDFISARLDEDEAAATRVVLLDEEGDLTGRYMLTLRVLAEVEAKRRIVEMHAPVRLGDIQGGGWGSTETLACEYDTDPDAGGYVAYPCETLMLLAAIYADHPDYDKEWRP